jgi:hypothetical protein
MTSTATGERHHESGEASIMDIDNNILAALFHDKLHQTFQVNGRWRDCSDRMQRTPMKRNIATSRAACRMFRWSKPSPVNLSKQTPRPTRP